MTEQFSVGLSYGRGSTKNSSGLNINQASGEAIFCQVYYMYDLLNNVTEI